MKIDYTNSPADYAAQAMAQMRLSPRLAYYHYTWVAYWGVMAALGVYVSLFSELIFIAMMFLVMYINYFVRAVPFSRVLRASLQDAVPNSGIVHIHLRLDEGGLHEVVEGQLESFAPWSAVRHFVIVDDHLLVGLAGNLSANVPKQSVQQGPGAFDELVGLLKSRGVPEV